MLLTHRLRHARLSLGVGLCRAERAADFAWSSVTSEGAFGQLFEAFDSFTGDPAHQPRAGARQPASVPYQSGRTKKHRLMSVLLGEDG